MNTNVILNIGDKESCLKMLIQFKENKYVPFYVRITNSNIRELNNVIGRNVFKKDALYINSLSLWEIMHQVGGKGKHNYHGLTPEDVYNALSRLQYSKEVYASYLDRYIIITDVNIKDDVYIVVIVTPKSDVPSENLENIISIVTIYPSNRKIDDKNKK